MRILPALLLTAALQAPAATLTEDFSSRAGFASGTAVWNQALGKIHPSLQVANYTLAAPPPIAVDVGDGSHGAFNSSTYQNFGTVSGNVIHLDTNAYPILKVTSFVLEDGWTLEPSGNNPLIIYSLSDVVIEGEIWCHGEPGKSAALGGAGGTPRCGGKRGGDGGAPGAAGGNGDDADPTVTGGQGGNVFGSAVAGGGGGAWNDISPTTPGANVNGGGGAAGSNFNDPEFDTIAGGAGGGGGAGFGGEGGGGGGAGGGVVIIHAVGDFTLGNSIDPLKGIILANGGDGGAAGLGGAGGGGGGGSVQVFAGGTINIYSNRPPAGTVPASNARKGSGGTNTAAEAGGEGGMGRSWFTSTVYNGVGFYDPNERLPVQAGDFAEFVTTPQTVISRAYDLGASRVTVNGLTALPASPDFAVEVAGSSDNFASDDTGWTTDLTLLKDKRYVRFRVTVTAANPITPDMLDSLAVDYIPELRTQFDFKAAGCGRTDSGARNILPMLLFLAFLLGLKLKTKKKHTVGA